MFRMPTWLKRPEPILLILVLAIFVWSGLRPHDRFTWLLEVFPVILGVPVLIYLYPRFRFTPLVYTLLTVHAIILMVGGKYTYAEVPLGFWLQQTLGLARNHYDRIGHLAQGFIPAIVAREILIRRSPLQGSRWLPFLAICICLALSALYELIEFWTALATGEAAEAFLGTQGDPWDTQWDMMLALIGAITALALLSRWHDRQIDRLQAYRGAADQQSRRGPGIADPAAHDAPASQSPLRSLGP
jgi:putative membrane protein